MDEQYRLEKVIPFHANSSFMKAHQKFWQKYLNHKMTFTAFVGINPFYGEDLPETQCPHRLKSTLTSHSPVLDLILSSSSIISTPCKCESECTCNFAHDECYDGPDCPHAEQALQKLEQGVSLYYQDCPSPEDRERHRLRRVEDLRNAAEFPELRVNAQRLWLEAVGIQLVEAIDYMACEVRALSNSCVRYLDSPATRSRFKIFLRNGLLIT